MNKKEIDYAKLLDDLKKSGLTIVKDIYDTYYGIFNTEDKGNLVYAIQSRNFEIEFKKLYYKVFKVVLKQYEVKTFQQFIELDLNNDVETVELANRVYIDENGVYVYELNTLNECVFIENGEIFIDYASGVVFKHNVDYDDQVTPNLDVDHRDLIKYVRKHFNIKSKKQAVLFAIYLVTNFWGMSINHPILILTGEKGSSKSTTMRKIELIIDPKKSDLLGIPKGADGLEIRLSNSYFVSLDNLSSLSRKVSDTLARASTGGSVTKRMLYENSTELVLNIKTIVALNGISLVARESDLLDRSLIISLDRINSDEIRTEEDVWTEFECDLPYILGCCFKTLAIALSDNEPIETCEMTRMADFFVACIKIGRALGIPEETVSQLLWENQDEVNKNSIDEDIVGLCMVELMSDKTEYSNSVTGLLQDFTKIVTDRGMAWYVLPKLPNALSKSLNKLKSNLESAYGITYEIVNIGAFKEIRIQKM